jgi:hypothetical protein
MTATQRQHRFAVFFALGLVYFFWGSTYLGISNRRRKNSSRIDVCYAFHGCGSSHAGLLRRHRTQYSLQPCSTRANCPRGHSVAHGGNLTLSYAEQYVPSGIAALLVASIALWFLVLDALILGNHQISSRGAIGLLLGIAGLVVLLWPDLTATGALNRRQMWWSLALIAGSFSWALGSVLSKLWKSGGSLSATGWQVFFRRNRQSDFTPISIKIFPT